MNLRRCLLGAFSFTFLFAAPVFAANFTSDVESGLIKKNAIHTAHFQIEFSDIILNQTDSDGDDVSDIIETVAESAEHSWDLVIEDMNYERPNDERDVLIILDDNYEYLSSGVLGVTSMLSNGDPYMAVDPWMSETYLQVTTGHEFFHTVQFGYDVNFAYTNQGINWAEATAVWVEDELFDSIDDYVNYMPDFFDYPDYSVFSSIVPSGTLYEYGLNIWPRFLSEYYSQSTIKDIWETYFTSSLDYENNLKLYDAVKEVIEGKGDDLATAFQDFALWNLNLSNYEEGSSYPGLFMVPNLTFGEYTPIDQAYAPALYGTNYLYFENEQVHGDNFYFHIVKADGVAYVVSLVPVNNGEFDTANAVTTQVDMNSDMNYLGISDIGSRDGVMAVVSSLDIDFPNGENTGVFDEGYLYDYLASYEDRDEDFISLMGTGEASTPTEEIVQVKEGEDAEFNDGSSNLNTFVLSVLTYDQDSVTFSWKRIIDSEVQGYELSYGTKSGHYTETEEIENAYTTHLAIEDLEEGETYYFQLIGVDGAGDQVGDESQEVAVTPAAWIFEDVSYTDEYYDAIQSLVDVGIFVGYSDGTFRADDKINRAELLKILIEGRGIEVEASQYQNCFPDVKEEWFAKYVCYGKSAGWVQGYSDGTFRPGNAVNKVEALKILFKVYEAGLVEGSVVADISYTDLDAKAWYAIYTWKASVLGILEETFGGEFNPELERTRGQMAEELYRYLVVTKILKE